jgi:hypothetical protein
MGTSEACHIVDTGAGSLLALTCLEKTAMSSLKDSEEQTSPPATPGSRGVHVASSHFSKINASSGNKGCLREHVQIQLITIRELETPILTLHAGNERKALQ